MSLRVGFPKARLRNHPYYALRFTLISAFAIAPLLNTASGAEPYSAEPRLFPGEVTAGEAAGATVLEMDPSGQWKPVPTYTNAKGNISGTLPGTWSENSNWADVDVHYTQQKKDGISSLKISIDKLTSGAAQIVHSLPPQSYRPEMAYELTFKGASLTRTSLKVGVRQRGAPYKWMHEFNLNLTPTRSEHRIKWVSEPTSQPLGLFILAQTPGSIEIDRIELTRLDEGAQLAQTEQRFPSGWPANLFRNSQFPLGLQSGWSLDRESSIGDEIVFRPSTNATGTDAVPPLEIKTIKDGQKARISSAPVELPLAKESAKFKVRWKGTGTASLAVEDNKGTIRRKEVQLNSDDWVEDSLSFTTRRAGLHVTSIEINGSVEIDRVQIHRGKEDRPYERAGESEVHLASPRIERFFFEGEETTMQYAVLGSKNADTLRIKLINAYDQQVQLAPISLNSSSYQTGNFDWFQFPQKPFGIFRVEAWVEDKNGERISPYSEMVVHRLRKPHYWGKDAPDSPFGVHVESSARHLAMAKAIGINWARLHDAGLGYIGWFWLEPEQGQWTFFDDELQRYRDHQLKIFGELGTAPTWASYWTGSGRKHVGYFDRFFQPRDLDDYANYVSAVVERYKDSIQAYDVWNEPWIAEWWGIDWDENIGGREGWITSEEPQKDYVELKKVARSHAKAVSPDIQIAGFNTTSGGGSRNRVSGTEWTRKVIEHGGLAESDMIAFHMYERGSAAGENCSVTAAIERAVGLVRNEDGSWPKPIWMTEGSPTPGGSSQNFYHHTADGGDGAGALADAEQTVRYQVACLANGVSRIFLYSMHAHNNLAASRTFRTLVSKDGYLDAAAAAHSTLAWHLEDKSYAGEWTQGPESYRGYIFQDATETVIVMVPISASSGQTMDLGLEENTRLEDLFGNPITPNALTDAMLFYMVGERR